MASNEIYSSVRAAIKVKLMQRQINLIDGQAL